MKLSVSSERIMAVPVKASSTNFKEYGLLRGFDVNRLGLSDCLVFLAVGTILL
ncbi:hypothetical protein HanHA300_Chr13g0471051 [Helianthus annuus]|nr:hypothetical protein HanHA300_Chr13g0471051 [Helianthus annuus]KAJ0662754.1 hypothetical protein HanLR1_Chr13g0473251 [Helianthus annuus]KAJ0670266.1 hypothetical protein HanOQP8_Chr13g0472221 [Helianthus annuus]